MASSNGSPRDGQGRFAEVAVFVPVRPHWHQGKAEVPSDEQPLAERLQLFHYGIPDDLRSRLAPGHVVRVPFGRRTVKGVVMRRSSTSPVATRLILDLVQDKPVLGPRQLELAGWMAAFYGAPLSSCLSLFVPPGLLGRNQDRKPMGPRRDWYLQLAVADEDLVPRLLQAGRATRPVRLLERLAGLRQATGRTELSRAELQEVAGKGRGPALKALADKGLVGGTGCLLFRHASTDPDVGPASRSRSGLVTQGVSGARPAFPVDCVASGPPAAAGGHLHPVPLRSGMGSLRICHGTGHARLPLNRGRQMQGRARVPDGGNGP